MRITRKIDSVYAGAGVRMRFISKSMFWVCVTVGPVFVYGLLVNIIEKDYVAALVEGLFAALLFSGIPMILKKKIDLLSTLFIYMALFTGIVVGILSREPSLYAAYIAFAFLTPSLVSLALLGQSTLSSVISGLIAMGAIAYSYFFKALPLVPESPPAEMSATTLFMVPLLMALIIAILASMIVYTTRNIIDRLSESEKESKERVEQLTRLLQSLKETVNIGEDLHNSAGHSLDLTTTIGENLDSMESSVENLRRQILSTQEIHESIDRAGRVVREGSLTQSTAVEQSASAVEEMAASIVEMSKTAESKKQLIEQLVRTEKEVSAQIKTGQRSFDLVKKSTSEMLGVVAVISDIAERTNLLAMNAAIEAAHAGSTGKGFAVVAQEIRKLAVEAGTNSSKIKDIIENSIKGIDNAVDINSHVGSEFLSVSDQVREIDEALSEIISGFSELASGTSEITRVVENLAQINDSVRTSVGEVTGQLSKGRESVDAISTATEGIISRMNDIAGDSRSIREEAENIYKIGKDNVRHIRLLEDNLS